MLIVFIPNGSQLPNIVPSEKLRPWTRGTEQGHCAVLLDTSPLQPDWEEMAQEEINLAFPAEAPVPSELDEIRENQLILMDAVATLYETMIGSGS